MSVPRGTLRKGHDIGVVGAGHAGCEAALACARLGLSVALVTLRKDRIAYMPCNPAIGGLGKSQIVREIDALGGQMGRAADRAAIHHRRLNASRGPAVRARRVQCDMGLYQQAMLEEIVSCENLELIEGAAARVLTGGRGVCGLELEDGRHLDLGALILTTGTFLRGLVHIGLDSYPAGRLGDPPSNALSSSIEDLGLALGRLKTGTPARLDASSLDLDKLAIQPPDPEYWRFSHEEDPPYRERISCALTRTNPRTHEIIRAGLSRSPLFSGVIKGQGPRYCPSIEDKVVRFPDRDHHQVILEPTDLSQAVIYPNGISTSLPLDVQEAMIHSIDGLRNARMIQPGYAIEYDFVPPTQLKHTLEVGRIPGLFLAGQINGTSGYEEAAGQGLVAGINAAARLRGDAPLVLSRREAYIGVMVDDLVSRGTAEPYRMFSSRAEFRLLLREDNAVERLQEHAERIGLLPRAILAARADGARRVDDLVARLHRERGPRERAGRRPTLAQLLRRPGVRITDLLPEEGGRDLFEQAEVRIKYDGYIQRQIKEAEQLQRLEHRRIPSGIDYAGIPGLSREIADKLAATRPDSFAAAARVDGMTPAAMMILSIWLERERRGSVSRGTEGDGGADDRG